jgi:hypothetical protein
MNGTKKFRINGTDIYPSGAVYISPKNKIRFEISYILPEVVEHLLKCFNESDEVELEFITLGVENRSYKGVIYKAEKESSFVTFYIKVKKGSYQHTSLIPPPISYSHI